MIKYYVLNPEYMPIPFYMLCWCSRF